MLVYGGIVFFIFGCLDGEVFGCSGGDVKSSYGDGGVGDVVFGWG